MGGSESRASRAHRLGRETHACEKGLYADIEAARGRAVPDSQRRSTRRRRSRRPGDHDRGLASSSGSTTRRRRRRCRWSRGDRPSSPCWGRRSSSEEARRRSSRRPSARHRGRDPRGVRAPARSLGPIGIDVEVIADEALREGQFVAGEPRRPASPRRRAGRDYQPAFADIRQAKEGDACPVCGGRLSVQPVIEVGHIFKLETFHSEALDATFLDEDGRERPVVMGATGSVRPERSAAVEQHHDERGIVWPPSVAPYDVHALAAAGRGGRAARHRRGALGGGPRRAARRPRRAPGREVRRRRPARLPVAGHGGPEEPRGRGR